jgi:predicted DNA-binding transcriptional regulator YafY
MRADRLLSILLLLQVHRRVTARELAQKLEVSERTIHRDMEALSSSGIPVVAARGTGGGWALLDDYRTNLTGLNNNEIQALFLANPVSLLADLGLHKASEAALIKLLACLPAISRHNAEHARQRIHIDPTGWRQTEESCPLLPVLQDAIWREQKIRFGYRRTGSDVERVADPLGLVAKGSIWYLVAKVDDQVRTYRVARIQEVVILDEACIRPPDFDLAAYWVNSSLAFRANLPRYIVTLRVPCTAMPVVDYAGRRLRIEQVEPDEDPLYNIVTLRFDTFDEACTCVLGFGGTVEVLGPAELEERVLALAEGIVAAYVKRRHAACPSSVSSIDTDVLEGVDVLQSIKNGQ